jgi:hypothetical protein
MCGHSLTLLPIGGQAILLDFPVLWPLIDPTVEWWPSYPIGVSYVWPLIDPTVEWWPGYPIRVSYMWPLIDPT